MVKLVVSGADPGNLGFLPSEVVEEPSSDGIITLTPPATGLVL